MNESDLLPKQVCIECWTRIDNFHEFHAQVLDAQANYLDDLIKYEQENNFVDLQKPIDVDETVSIEPVDTLFCENELQNDSIIKTEFNGCKPTSSNLFLDESPIPLAVIDVKSIQADIFENIHFENNSLVQAKRENEKKEEILNDSGGLQLFIIGK